MLASDLQIHKKTLYFSPSYVVFLMTYYLDVYTLPSPPDSHDHVRSHTVHRRVQTHSFPSSGITHRSAAVIIVSFLGDTRSLNIFRTGRESHNWPWSICSPVCVLTLTSDFNELVLQ